MNNKNGTIDINGWRGGYGQTSYAASEVMGQQLGAQRVGTLTGIFDHNSLRFSNDILGDGEDRWRTFAAELNIGKWSVGTSLYTNWGLKESDNVTDDISASLLGKNKVGAWKNGRAYFAPLWVGYRKGNQITRIGYSHKMVQNLTQNFVHKFLTSTPYFLNYDDFQTGGYIYSGYNNPLSLWD